MDITQFVEQSIGQWRSQRSAHHLAFSHFEAVLSTIDIVKVSPEDPEAIALCKAHDIDPETIAIPFRMSWEGESDWDEKEVLSGKSLLIPVPNRDCPSQGRLLRDQGYAETVAAVGHYHFTDDNTFVLETEYDRAAAEEKIWFVNPNLRFRVSTIKTSGGKGVLTASFASEIRSAREK
ncbi:MAG: phycobiliprotein lyase [Cyanobacteria bacterium P01_A01_bin.45]